MPPPPPSQRRPSGARPPPMAPPGVPVNSKAMLIQPQRQAPHMSMPPSPKTTYAAQGPQHARQPRLEGSSISSRPSPALSSSSELRESTRVNIRQPARLTSATLTWETSPKEACLETPKEAFIPQMGVRDPLESQFDQLLDSLQVPDSVRQKFNTVSPDVKTILMSSATNNSALTSLGLPMPKEPKIRKRLSTPLLRKAKSSSSIGSPGQNPEVGKTYRVEGDNFVIVKSPNRPSAPPTPTRGQSMDMSRPNRSSTGPGRPVSFGLFSPTPSSMSKGSAKGLGIAMGDKEQPETFIQWLQSHKATDLRMGVARCKKLRMLLRHESTAWVDAFIGMGGYKLVLAKLQDLLDVEWREEQHDDQMLYELLRCVKALSTSEVGKTALRMHFPAPFPSLSSLLFSEKKPGDLPTRQIIIELWTFIFDLYPKPLRISVRFDESQPGPSRVTEVVRNLLAADLPDKTKEQHEFITRAHRPKVFRAWVGELSDICRDYFWVMCHGSNPLWDIDEVDPSLVEKPVAPGGATGGVEFEAMNYVTTHFRLLNMLCKAQAAEDKEQATQLHRDLLMSGMDRILVTLRKASTAYYPTLHLELARYVSLLQAASPNARLPHLIEKLVGSPPEELRKKGPARWLKGMELQTDGGRRGGFDMQL